MSTHAYTEVSAILPAPEVVVVLGELFAQGENGVDFSSSSPRALAPLERAEVRVPGVHTRTEENQIFLRTTNPVHLPFIRIKYLRFFDF
jgi:hypothetical protein